jgi:hypothetical protein
LVTTLFFILVLIPYGFSQTLDTIKISSYSWYVNSSGNFIVVGEVQNIGNSIFESLSLNVFVRGTDGSQLASGTTTIYAKYILPQQKAPFHIDFGNLGANVASRVSVIGFSISKAPSTIYREYSDLSAHTVFNGVSNGYYTIIGAVTNSGTQTANDVKVIATYYNSSGIVVAVGYVLLNDLTPNNSTVFSVSEFDATSSSASQISNYSLLIQTATLQNSSPTPSPTLSPSPSATPTPSPTPTVSPVPTPSPTASPTPFVDFYPNNYLLVIAGLVGAMIVIVIVLFVVLLTFKRRGMSSELPPPPS